MSNVTVGSLGPLPWIDMVLLGWFFLTAYRSVRRLRRLGPVTNNPELKVMKWAGCW
jgi:hypothetical protein